MLIETKGITELALVYGSTWIVISIVVIAILMMAYCANLLIIKKFSPSINVTYSFLAASMIIGWLFTFTHVNTLSPLIGRIITPVILTLPLFFSGLAFSSELKKSSSVDVALSSNLLGAMLGGFFEYNSMYFGFRSLYIFSFMMYLVAFMGSKRARNG